MGLFEQRKGRSFNYTPRSEKVSSIDDVQLKMKWESVKRQGKHKSKRVISLPLLLVFLGMIIALLYFLTQYETA